MKLDIKKGDTILTGKFRNKKTEVKEFGTDSLGQPTINGKTILKFRIAKTMPSKKTNEMKHLKIYEDFAGSTGGNPYDLIGNAWLTKILKEEEKVDAKIIDPKDGEFIFDFNDDEGTTMDREVIWEFKGNKGEDYSIMIQYDFGWETTSGIKSGDRLVPDDPDEVTMNWLEIHPAAFFYDDDDAEENEFTVNEENIKLLENFFEREIPVDKIKL